MSIYHKWAQKEYPLVIRIISTLFAGTIFVLFIPVFMLKYSIKLDKFFDISYLGFEALNLVIGGIAILTGAFFALWSIISQISSGRGTPIPAMATQKLLVRGPFKYSRNPMSFGTILAYLGLSIFKGSISMILLTIFFSTLLILYIKLLEEKELIERFGDPYRDYMERTAFIIPAFKKQI